MPTARRCSSSRSTSTSSANLYYGSYKAPREVLYIIGVLIYLLMMATAFMGYVLPWGQMSFWGATVITNILAAIPVIGDTIQSLLWGGYSVGNPTLNRFFSLHYLLPFMIFGRGHPARLGAARAGQEQPDRHADQIGQGRGAVHALRDHEGHLLTVVFLIFFAYFVFYMPNYLGHADNYVPANPAVTPAHIVPEWYFLPFYAILRAIPDKLGGVIAMFGAIGCWPSSLARHLAGALHRLPPALQAVLLDLRGRLHPARLARRQAAGGLVRDRVAGLRTAYYFIHFLVILPLLGFFERRCRCRIRSSNRVMGGQEAAGRACRPAPPPSRNPKADASAGEQNHDQAYLLIAAAVLRLLGSPALRWRPRPPSRRSQRGASTGRSATSTGRSSSAASRSTGRSAPPATA